MAPLVPAGVSAFRAAASFMGSDGDAEADNAGPTRRLDDAPPPSSYDAQLTAVKRLKASGAPPDEVRAAAAKLHALKRMAHVPRHTASRKALKKSAPGASSVVRDDPGGTRMDVRRTREPKGPRMACPACGTPVKASHPDQFRAHVGKCCPDAVAVVPKDAWGDLERAASLVAAHEAELTAAAKALAYGGAVTPRSESSEGDDEGEGEPGGAPTPGTKMSHEEVASRLGVTAARVKEVLRRASRAVPLVSDDAPLDVLYEDEELLVVNKPPGLRFHPVHRFEGNSLLSRCIGHVRRGTGKGEDAPLPHIVHRLDMDTSGVCMFVKDRALVDGFARQFRGDDARARKEYIALSVGFPPVAADALDAVADGREKEKEGKEENTHASGSSGPSALVGSAFVVDAHIGPHPTIAEARAVHPPPSTPAPRPGDPRANADRPKPARTLCVVIAAAAADPSRGERRADGRVPTGGRIAASLAPASVEDGVEASVRAEGDGEGAPSGRARRVMTHPSASAAAVLVLAKPETGRTHQIRVHLQHAALPILSDPLYGPHVVWDGGAPCTGREEEGRAEGEGRGGEWGGKLWLGRQALHAARLTVRHPARGDLLTFVAPLPADMRRACVALGLDPDAPW